MSRKLNAAPWPQQQQRRSLSVLLNVAVDHAKLLSYVLIAVGLLGLLALPLLERKIDFDENALLAGSARPTIRSKSPGAYAAGKALAASLQSSLFSSNFSAALQHQLKQHLPSVHVYHHTFTVARWGSRTGAAGSSSARACTNVHVVLNAGRGDGKEALLLGTPINHQDFSSDFEQEASGALLALSLGGALLHHLASSAPWLAKEVVWLLPDASCGLVESVQAWADAYQNPALSEPSLQHFSRAGVLQQAMLLELPAGSLNTLQVSLESYEGLLPKLDMFWLFRWYCYHYVRAPLELAHMGWTFDSSTMQQLTNQVSAVLDPMVPGSSRAVQHALQAVQQHILKFTMACQFMWRQARGLPTGAHAPFKGLMVDAATLRILRKDPEGFVVGPAGFTRATGNSRRNDVDTSGARGVQAQHVLGFDDVLTQLGDVVELTLRSCNVLIERFHHSLFLYVLTDLDNYVSVERYIGPLVALICVLAVQASAIIGSPAAAKDSLSMLPQHVGQLVVHGMQRLKKRPKQIHQASITSSARIQQLEPTAENSERKQPTVLQPEDVLQLPSQEEAAAARTQWVVAIKLVAAVHTLAVAAGYAMRNAPALLPLLQQPDRVALWLAAVAQAPKEHASNVGVGCGVLLALLSAAQGLMSASGYCFNSAEEDSQNSVGSSRSKLLRKVLAVEYSVAAAACAAAACLNWALGYVVCLVLVPLAVGCAPAPLKDKPNANSSSIRWSCISLLCCSPPSVLLIMTASSFGAGAAGLLPCFVELMLHSSAGAFMVFWAVYVPFWCLALCSATVAWRKAEA